MSVLRDASVLRDIYLLRTPLVVGLYQPFADAARDGIYHVPVEKTTLTNSLQSFERIADKACTKDERVARLLARHPARRSPAVQNPFATRKGPHEVGTYYSATPRCAAPS